MRLGHSLTFFKRYLCNPNLVGAIAPSSRALAAAVCEPLRRASRPATILEVGAGTGAITQHIGSILKPSDRLDICEIQTEFADILERDVLSKPAFATAKRDGRLRLLRMPVQDLPETTRYDFIISGLPLTAFALEDVQDVYAIVRRALLPGGVFSYYEYVGMRRTGRTFSVGKKRLRYRSVSDYLSENIRKHEYKHRIVLRNFPPAYARHLRFDPQTTTASDSGDGAQLGLDNLSLRRA